MTLEGTIIDGQIVLDHSDELPEGARVEVTIKTETKPASALAAALLRHAGKAQGLPEDMAAQHDHYLHGTPKR